MLDWTKSRSHNLAVVANAINDL